jgi:hypothetical protein
MIYTRMRRWASAEVLGEMFEQLQRQQLVQIRIQTLSLDSASIEVRPEVRGAQKTGHGPSASFFYRI